MTDPTDPVPLFLRVLALLFWLVLYAGIFVALHLLTP
jgi:hypothetical protein